ncbi:hypothetical protein E2562_005130 [Oryza meyeriana var. granulata]|uniref:Uncharacterized protein n=1 Tax=Oryza meyeriana var. granulata TaxID=110450 RepID=A0A6G1BTF8_9ORYZ|nr:hypothetical protein E2562_005130 [Oryza meyeriana var. granulata]
MGDGRQGKRDAQSGDLIGGKDSVGGVWGRTSRRTRSLSTDAEEPARAWPVAGQRRMVARSGRRSRWCSEIGVEGAPVPDREGRQ